MSFWKPIRTLLRVRIQVARTKLAANPTAALWTALALLVLLLTAFRLGQRFGGPWLTLPEREAEANLGRLWLEMQAFWLLTLLFPSGIALLGQIPPRSTLLPFPLRPFQIFVAEVSAVLLDAPGLLACALTLPFLGLLLEGGRCLQAGVTLVAFTLLGVQTGICARLLAAIGAIGARRFRRLTAIPGMTAALFLCVCAGMPPAFASLTSSPAQHLLPAHLSTAISPAVDLVPLLPSHLAAHAVVATRQRNVKGAIGSLVSMAGCLLLTGGAALWALRSAERTWVSADGKAISSPTTQRPPPAVRSHSGPLRQTIALVRTEWRLLLRTPQNYLPLRKPASLLLLGVFAFLAPDMGKNPVSNLEELLAIGSLLYSVLWQLQLLCNRFGNEAGTGALLFGFSIPRRRLLLGKNIALFGLLLLVDSPILIGMAFVAEVPNNIGLFLGWLPLILVTLTSLGNIASVLHPFAIRRQAQQSGAEPPDMLTGVYLFVGGATIALLAGVAELLSHRLIGQVGAIVALSALYATSLYETSALLHRYERRMIAATSPFE